MGAKIIYQCFCISLQTFALYKTASGNTIMWVENYISMLLSVNAKFLGGRNTFAKEHKSVVSECKCIEI